MDVLLLGFSSFPGMEKNHSSSIVKHIYTHQGNIGLKIRSYILPVSFEKCKEQIEAQFMDYTPDAIVLVGIKFTSTCINLEKVALNIINSQSADSDGVIINDKQVIPEGREAYFSAFDLRPLNDQLTVLGIPSTISYHAGTYVCNQAYYIACYLLEKIYSQPKALLIHIPRLLSQLPHEFRKYGITYNTSLRAVRSCLEVLRDELIHK
jgi:pyroglutamyl-peptidase